jgi:hypothetical protein
VDPYKPAKIVQEALLNRARRQVQQLERLRVRAAAEAFSGGETSHPGQRTADAPGRLP